METGGDTVRREREQWETVRGSEGLEDCRGTMGTRRKEGQGERRMESYFINTTRI